MTKMVECRLPETDALTGQQRSIATMVQEVEYSSLVQRDKSDKGLDYDRTVFIANPFKAEKEEDDFKDSIAFYYPPSELEDDRINLCGQISGLYKMLLAFPGAPPDFISTRTRGYAVKTLGKEFIIVSFACACGSQVIFTACFAAYRPCTVEAWSSLCTQVTSWNNCTVSSDSTITHLRECLRHVSTQHTKVWCVCPTLVSYAVSAAVSPHRGPRGAGAASPAS